MRKMLLILLTATIAAAGCTNDPERPSAKPSLSPGTATPADDVTAEVQIYSSVIRRLVTRDHTFGRGKSPFEHVFVVSGPIPNAGDPRADEYFGPASEPFPPDVIAGIEEELEDLPPVTFVADGNDVRRGKQGMGGVKNDGVIISMGPIEPKKEGVHVSNGLWCGGRCGQWLTYVLAEEGGQWKVTGTTGPSAIS